MGNLHAMSMNASACEQVSAAAMAFESGTSCQQPIQRLLIKRAALALVADGAIVSQPEARQRAQLILGGTGLLARWVDVLDP